MDQATGIPIFLKKSDHKLFPYRFRVYNLQEIERSILF